MTGVESSLTDLINNNYHRNDSDNCGCCAPLYFVDVSQVLMCHFTEPRYWSHSVHFYAAYRQTPVEAKDHFRERCRRVQLYCTNSYVLLM